jgi:aminomethyltransferase
MKYTPLYEKHIALGAKMIEYAGYQMPLSYSDISEEHIAVRTHMGIFDVSHMGEFIVEGKDALKYVNALVTNIISDDLNKVTYTLFCQKDGNVVDDLLVYVITLEKILLVVNAGNMDKDFDWVIQNSSDYEVNIRNISDQISQIALQGPKAVESIESVTGFDATEMKFMTQKAIPFDDGHVILSRTGYTGEDGFEIYGNPKYVTQMWDKAIELGAVPCGLGARDTLRFEANLPLYGHEISETINPIEAGLNFAIKLEKDYFIGKDALLAYKENPKRKVVGLELNQKAIPRHGYPVYMDDQEIGVITTGYLLPQSETPIACALIDIAYSKLGTPLYVQIRKNKVSAVVRNRKFYTKNYIK